ncbi:cobalamin biosynthesis protein CobW [Halioglobus japonicus]|uniref:Cobalamin biosynthesis protein CobW n=1 Tax=Halioglobus japonicus TaxID=930805 RepID=A0AAP8MF28_9GAMM|nr:CobW family GTP-binding protein [Halioglobus japonicus]AQA18598.1 cobalamin biosynthesis protein CobW [Halioglobus japonicus]PLW86622.1 cobalamin biosynthesis protein CobW [Halioglobus japonicus]GHD11916.1 hypothetical protein GCM10007052_12180 [Halioglobus japonicus]
MSSALSKITGVPTNIITGFLGAGKTTAILNLLAHKPEDERWAVLVNEFGEIGVDGSLVEGQSGEATGVFIREVPGGCMCCTAGLPMQIALAQLLRRAKPQRLLIEPTGLGHPLEVLQTLSAEHNREVLTIQKTLTVVDARNIADERYSTHATFEQQLAIADLVIANKQDLYSDSDKANLQAYVEERCRPGVDIVYTEYGQVPLTALDGPTAITANEPAHQHARKEAPLLAEDLPFPECGYVTAMNQGEGFESIGWRFNPEIVFDRQRLFAFLSGLQVERLKAVFITADGIFGYNMTRDALTESVLGECAESRIEIITDAIQPQWIDKLTDCLDQAA